MNEFASYNDLKEAMKVARDYGHRSIYSDRVCLAFRSGRHIVYHRVNTPAPKKIPVLYSFVAARTGFFIRTFLVLEGTEGDSFSGSVADGTLFFVLHSHAVNRYIERHHFNGSLEEAQRKILDGLMINNVQCDATDGTKYIHFDGGLFLCTESDRVMHLRTFIMNRQCSLMQRMKSLVSEKNTEYFKREIGLPRLK